MYCYSNIKFLNIFYFHLKNVKLICPIQFTAFVLYKNLANHKANELQRHPIEHNFQLITRISFLLNQFLIDLVDLVYVSVRDKHKAFYPLKVLKSWYALNWIATFFCDFPNVVAFKVSNSLLNSFPIPLRINRNEELD